MFLWSLKALEIQVLRSLCMVVMLALLPPAYLQDLEQQRLLQEASLDYLPFLSDSPVPPEHQHIPWTHRLLIVLLRQGCWQTRVLRGARRSPLGDVDLGDFTEKRFWRAGTKAGLEVAVAEGGGIDRD